MNDIFSIEQTVYIEDTDYYGVVYYANYLKFFERARTEWLKAHQITLRECRDNDCMFVVREAKIKYHQPLLLQDCFRITAVPRLRSRTSIVFAQAIYTQQQTDKCIAEGEVTLVTVNEARRVVRIPSMIADKVA